MEKHIARVNGWVKYDDFDPLKHVFSDAIVLYIKGMYQKAARRRDEYDLPSRDYEDIGGYDVFPLTPQQQLVVEQSVSESEILNIRKSISAIKPIIYSNIIVQMKPLTESKRTYSQLHLTFIKLITQLMDPLL